MIPFYCLVNNFVAISRLDSNPKLSLIVSACLPASNILFKFIFIQLNWGMQGIALSTVLSCVFVTLISATHFLTKNNHFKFILPKDFIAKRTINIIKYGSSELNSEISTFLFGIVANLILVTFVGPVGLVAYSILSNIEMVGSSLHYGVNQAASYISALLFGEEDKDGVRQGLLLGVSSGFILTFLFALCVLLFPNIFVSFFGLTNPDAYNTTIFAISIYALIIPLDAVVDAYTYYFNSTSRVLYSNIICFCQYFVANTLFMLVVCPILPYEYADLGVWFSYVFRVFFCIILVIFLLWNANRKAVKAGGGTKNFIDWILALPAGFASDWIDVRRLKGFSNVEVANRAGKILQNALVEEGIFKDKAMFICLALEEMSRNTFEHGYKHNKRKPRIEISLVQMPNEIFSLRFRDNGNPFNPLEYNTDQGDKFSNIGIRMVKGLVTDMQYSNIINLNNLVANFDCSEGK